MLYLYLTHIDIDNNEYWLWFLNVMRLLGAASWYPITDS